MKINKHKKKLWLITSNRSNKGQKILKYIMKLKNNKKENIYNTLKLLKIFIYNANKMANA